MNLQLGTSIDDFKEYRNVKIIHEASLEDECITALASFQSNLYVGTNKGQLLHYYRMDDIPGFMLISQQSTVGEDSNGNNSEIVKIVVVENIERVLVLSGASLYIYSLPELSPIQSGKLKDVKDILWLPKNTKNEPYEQVLVLTKNKIRVIRFGADEVKLIKDINDVSPKKAIVHESNNFVTIANENEYEIVDLVNSRKVPLFLYVSDQSNDIMPSMVSFNSLDASTSKPSEEVLLAVESDKDSSIGMFINAEGDVTRGTMTWLDHGYPTGGLAVQWPYVMGIFYKKDEDDSFVISSLIDLDVKFNLKIHNILQVDDLPSNRFQLSELKYSVSVDDSDLNDRLSMVSIRDNSKHSSPDSQLVSSNILISQGNEIWLVYPENVITLFEEELVSFIKSSNETSKLSFFMEQSKAFVETKKKGSIVSYFSYLLLIYHMSTKDWDTCKTILSDKIDLRFILFCLPGFDASDEVWTKYQIMTGIKTIIDDFIRSDILDTEEFKLFGENFIKDTYLYGKIMNDVNLKVHLRKHIYNGFTKSDELISFAAQNDLESWKGLSKDESLNDLIKLFDKKGLKVATLYLYSLNPIFYEKVCYLSTGLMTGKIEDLSVETSGNPSFSIANQNVDLPELIMKSVGKVEDSNLYRNSLLELLRVDPKRGVEFMKQNINGKHKETHSPILKEILDLAENEDFSNLKLEVLENSFVQTIKNDNSFDKYHFEELLSHLLDVICSSNYTNELTINNFMILYHTYKIENSFENQSHGTMSWIEFLQSIKDATECSKFIELYLKAFELLSHYTIEDLAPIKTQLSSIVKSKPELFSFFDSIFLDTENLLSNLLAYGDYYSAEFYALFEIYPTPKHLFYFKNIQPTLEMDYNDHQKDNLIKIFDNYKLSYQSNKNHNALSHFICIYGVTFFTPREMLSMLPEDISISCIQSYLEKLLINMETTQKKLTFKKTFSRQETLSTKELYNDFLNDV